jgi:hypothetical protein
MSLILRATTEQVTTAWLKGVVGDRVATTLPKDNASWAASGFCTVVTVGGGASMYVPLREPVLAVDCWAVNPDSQKPPWFKAAQLAEAIQAACHAHTGVPSTVVLGDGYPSAQVKTAYTAYEARRVPDDASSYARYTLGLVLGWVEVPS